MSTDREPGEERTRTGPALPQLRLDELLAEVQARLQTVMATRDRMHALLEAVVSIGSDLDLDTVLHRLTEAAATLVDARYGALGVIDEEGERLARFFAVGMSQEEIEAVGHWPHGHGILGLLIKDPRPLRLHDLTEHPSFYGFPPGHPPMKQFLGVPIRVRGEVFGNLYLTEKIGGGDFDEEDETVVTALATAAGVAVENARLYEEGRRRERWLKASGEVTTALLSGRDRGEVMGLVAERARRICDAHLAAVSLLDRAASRLVVQAAAGPDADRLRGLRLPSDQGVVAAVCGTGESRALAEGHPDAAEVLPGVAVGPVLVTPLVEGDRVQGVVAVAGPPGGAAFGEETRRLLEAFAGPVTVALELAERRRDAERIALLEDRDRIAKDLHDTVIQRLFATAMTLMSAAKLVDHPDVAQRIHRAIDDLDDTIRQIRSTIFALQTGPDEEGLRSRLHAVVDDAAEQLGFAPSVRLDGLLDTVVEDEVAEHLIAVTREALSNVARHAEAGEAAVTVSVGDDLVLRVDDDGVGIPKGGRRSGLRNMAERAERLGGDFSTRDRPGGGTTLVWRVPLRRDA
ncbi:GAF domain-containing protein [Thermomonospora catenispora]|uniref:GAF domain-containing sensor histidine kinase n=1 Tax=Thermomonospora catenispora TaxID=2493090 RepID=UPI00158F0FB4|nr:GAF domain-containing protein [Thermomonospora catenispora]